ncbi:MAG TPA: FAD-dependent oxidoreductase, partial [Chitinophagales bacterium]|nr:FAD-dependent oxidoreductase [Chitinophagales bacterium]
MAIDYDVAIIGAGAMGSAAAFHLAKTGRKILVLDRYTPPHHFGSSHGQSRIIREAYFENPMYVPLVQQAYVLWEQLEEESGKTLFLKTGGLMLGSKDQKVFRGAAISAAQHGIEYEFLDHVEIKKRFPVMQPEADTVALLEKNAGILFPEECIRTQLEL